MAGRISRLKRGAEVGCAGVATIRIHSRTRLPCQSLQTISCLLSNDLLMSRVHLFNRFYDLGLISVKLFTFIHSNDSLINGEYLYNRKSALTVI